MLECPGTTAFSLRTTLQLITAPIQSLSVYDFDRSVTTLTPDMFSASKLHIRHLQFSQSHLELVADNALRTVSNSLESLSIVNGKLKRVSPLLLLLLLSTLHRLLNHWLPSCVVVLPHFHRSRKKQFRKWSG